MKTAVLALALVLTSATAPLFAQQTIVVSPPSNQSKTDALFRGPRVGSLNKRFDFLLPAGNRMILEFDADNQVDSLPDIDSLVQVVWQNLTALGDSLTTPLANKRVDVVFSAIDTKVRVQDFPQKGASYRIKDGDVTQLKVEQDTLRVRLFTRRASLSILPPMGQSYYITFLVNHIADLPSILAQQPIGATIALFRTDFAARKHKKASAYFTRYYAGYDVVTQKRISPLKGNLNSFYHKVELIPYVQVSLQYLRGAWVPSAGAGLELINKLSENVENRFQLLWEPHFVFGGDSLKRNGVQRNDFITFRYHTLSKYNGVDRKIEFRQTFSLGYLIRRKGTHFEASTFKFSLPGLQTKNILLEPEFFFNNLFKNFSPSLRLTLFLE